MHHIDFKSLIVGDKLLKPYILEQALEGTGASLSLKETSDLFSAYQIIASEVHDLVILDLELVWPDRMDFFDAILEQNRNAIIIAFAEEASVHSVIEAIKRGACNYFYKKEFVKDLVLDLIRKSITKVLNGSNSEEFEDLFLNIELPRQVNFSLHQYLLYFERYALYAKGIQIIYELKEQEGGLKIGFESNQEIGVKEFRNWLAEYLSFLDVDLDNISVNFEFDTTVRNADLLIADLRNQVSHFKNTLEIEKLRNNLLQDQNEFLKKLSLSFLSRAPEAKDGSIKTKKQEVIYLIKEDRTVDALKLLISQFADDKVIYNQLILIHSRYTRLELETSLKIIDRETYDIELNRIKASVLTITERYAVE